MICLVSTNPGKLVEFQKSTINYKLVLPPSLDIENFSYEEIGHTYEENALIKVQALWDKTNLCLLSDDSGVEVEILQNRPGLHSATYGGKCSSEERYLKLLEEIKKLSPKLENIKARFVCVLCLRDPKLNIKYFQGQCEGFIGEPQKGNLGFGYDPIFYPKEFPGLSYAQLSSEEKNSISHRGRAIKKMLEYLNENFKGFLDEA